MSLKNNIDKIIQREAEIEQLLVNSFNLKPSELVELSKELSDIKPVTDLAKKKDVMLQELLDLSEILNDNEADDDIKKVALSEFEFLKEEINILERNIQFALLPKDKDDTRNVIIEVRAGTGGDEAGLFASDLFSMYEKLSMKHKHLPSGIVVSQQDEKSQHKNRAKAMKILLSRLYETERQKQQDQRSSSRKDQVGSGDRSERIRTYNYPQGRVTDHRINLTLHKLDKVIQGEALDELIDALIVEDRSLKLASNE